MQYLRDDLLGLEVDHGVRSVGGRVPRRVVLAVACGKQTTGVKRFAIGKMIITEKELHFTHRCLIS